jgi:hypothetical protein
MKQIPHTNMMIVVVMVNISTRCSRMGSLCETCRSNGPSSDHRVIYFTYLSHTVWNIVGR